MNTMTRRTIHWFAVSEFVALFLVSALMLYYAITASNAAPGDFATDTLESILRRQEDAMAILGAIVVSLPAITLRLATTTKGNVTKNGCTYVAILVPTCILAAVTNIWLLPDDSSPGSREAAQLVDTTALRISSYCLSYILAVMGLSRLFGDRTEGVN